MNIRKVKNKLLAEKALQKQTEKLVADLTSLNSSNKKDELKQIESILQQNLMNDLIRAKLKEIVSFQDIIKTDELNYKSKVEKFIILVSILYLLLFKRYT